MGSRQLPASEHSGNIKTHAAANKNLVWPKVTARPLASYAPSVGCWYCLGTQKVVHFLEGISIHEDDRYATLIRKQAAVVASQNLTPEKT